MKPEIKQRIEQINNGEVPDGYKKTEFGVFPFDWVTDKKLADVGVFGKGKGLPGDKMSDSGVPCVGYGDIYMKYNHFHFEKAQNFVDEETAKESQPIEKGTLLFTGTGETAEEIGKCVCYNGNETIYAGGDILTFNTKTVNPLFLAYQQYQPYSLRKKASFGQGHSVVHIQRENLEKLPIAYPADTKEQEKIAEILMKWDEEIELQEKYVEKLKLKRKSMLQKVFPTDKSNTTIKLGDYLIQCTNRNKDNIDNVKSVSNIRGFIDQKDQFSKEVASEDLSNYKVVKKGNIAYNPSRINVGSIAIYEDENPGIVSPMYVVFSCNGISPKYLLLLLESCRGKYEIKSYLSGSVRDSLSFEDLCDISLPIPAMAQETIVCAFEEIEKVISHNNDLLQKMIDQRKVLQQYLLNGIVRVI